MELKVGDRVRIKTTSNFSAGSKGVVTALNSDPQYGRIRVKRDGESGLFYPEELGLIEEEKIKPGDYVQHINQGPTNEVGLVEELSRSIALNNPSAVVQWMWLEEGDVVLYKCEYTVDVLKKVKIK